MPHGAGVGSGYLRIKPAAAEGASNIHMMLSAALANNRTVDIHVVDNQISQATLR